MATYTPNYGLHQWAPEDSFLRSDFNADFLKIDGALGGKQETVTGTYVGDGTDTRTIDLGFDPQMVLLFSRSGCVCDGYHCYGGLALPNNPVYHKGRNAVALTEGGFQVGYLSNNGTSVATNTSNTTYFYLAAR